jgi:hypothetical protein
MEVRDLFNYGVPTALLMIVLWALWRLTTWARDKVVEPVVKSHLELIDALKTHVPKQTDAINAQSTAINAQSKEISDQTKAIDKQTDMLEKRTDLFTEIRSNQHKIIDKLSGGAEGAHG